MLMISMIDIEKKKQHTHAHAVLREMLRLKNIEYTSDTPVVKGEYGKPSLAEHPDVYYNLSHANGIAACIVTDAECGIDCENVRTYRPNVMKRAFSESERECVENASEDERDLLFFRFWTLKEAFVKTIGIGISYPMESIEFSFTDDEIISNHDECRFCQYTIDGGKYIVSTCELRYFPENPML